MLTVSELHAGYGESEVLHGVDLDVPAGGIRALMGRNGMGKTTLLRTLMGLLPARRGAVRFKDADITRLATHEIARLGLAYVPQGREVFAGFTVAENLRLSLLGHRRGPRAVPDEIFDWFPILAERRDQMADTLSGGQQQMLAIGRALATAPEMLLLDEPTEGIQPSIVHEIGVTLGRIAADTGLTVLVVEQNIDLVLTVARDIAFMDNGVIVEVASAAAMTRDDPVIARHLSL
ncbi:MAG: ABC transporter ATP-binding protein [Alphaproteobacteria bacterium]